MTCSIETYTASTNMLRQQEIERFELRQQGVKNFRLQDIQVRVRRSSQGIISERPNETKDIPRRKKRHVSFAKVDQCTRIHYIPQIDAGLNRILWWDSESLQEGRECDKVKANSLKTNPDYHESVVFLLKSYKKDNQCRDKLSQRVRVIRNADARGLEQRIVPMLKAIRLKSVREVLSLQKKLKDEGLCRSDLATALLRQKSLKMSRAARQLSFRLAQSDRLEAKDTVKI